MRLLVHGNNGFHRFLARKHIGAQDIECHVHDGTAKDALWFALGANVKMGLRRMPSDMAYAIEVPGAQRLHDRTAPWRKRHYCAAIPTRLEEAKRIPSRERAIGKDGRGESSVAG